MNPVNIILFKVNESDTLKNVKYVQSWHLKISEQRSWRRSGVSSVNIEHISHLFLVLPLFTLNR